MAKEPVSKIGGYIYLCGFESRRLRHFVVKILKKRRGETNGVFIQGIWSSGYDSRTADH